jgi:hypothetical protein
VSQKSIQSSCCIPNPFVVFALFPGRSFPLPPTFLLSPHNAKQHSRSQTRTHSSPQRKYTLATYHIQHQATRQIPFGAPTQLDAPTFKSIYHCTLAMLLLDGKWRGEDVAPADVRRVSCTWFAVSVGIYVCVRDGPFLSVREVVQYHRLGREVLSNNVCARKVRSEEGASTGEAGVQDTETGIDMQGRTSMLHINL